MTHTKFNEILSKGIATDTFLADLNYNVYRKIFDRVNHSRLEKTEQKLFNYIRINAKENAILSIARVYDSESKKYKTRCIDELINNSVGISISYPFELFPNKWEEFESKYKLIFDKMEVDKMEPQNYIRHFIAFYRKFKTSDSSFQHLKNWRDKILAHNEPFDSSELNIDFEEIEFLILIPKSIIEYASTFMDTENSIIMFDGRSDSYFIDDLISKYVG
ncbi:AbiU2 domain-containing protein [Constantimarinum furrinae]|uniref:HEPN AbiU2-like domain-containing protein n=1 Tax=Constantimarinum furrinae TaxID=2562285 RepID=A0A7G8PUZ6_9FLAO|nr:hypothetical protein [Constantimarinum furrinae]QNJ98162.1 hypothetical protein ALE3EI_1606 [Constantimarinum furrinae]